MKAIRIHAFGGPEALRYEEIPDPTPGAGQVVVRAKAIGVNPVDTYIRDGRYGERSFPFILGFDAAGIVEAVGSGVGPIKKDDRVYTYRSINGAYAELILCAKNQVHTLPPNISFSQGAAMGVPYTTAYYALMNRGMAQPGETILIHGASGGVGVAAIQIARAMGLKVIGTAGTPKGRELVLKEGAQHVLDHQAPHYLEVLKDLTGGKGVNIILEMLANVNLAKDLKVLAAHGRVVVIGSRGEIAIDPRDTMMKNADIRGMSILTVSDDEISGVETALLEGLTNGSLRPVVGKEIPWAEVARAHEAIRKAGAYGKIVLIP
jgi:NADPH2:quinone reductase